MDAVEFLRRAARVPSSQLRDAETRRNVTRIEEDYRECLRAGRDPAQGLDLTDPLCPSGDEGERIVRAARLAGLGTFTWPSGNGAGFTWSEEMSRMLGLPPDHGRPSWRLYLERVHRADRDEMANAIDQTWRSLSVVEHHHRVVRLDGEIRHMHCFLQVVLDASGDPAGIVGTVRDITEDVRVKRELERVNKRYETILTVVGESLADRDPLTGLFNRRRFVAELDRALPAGGHGALLLIHLEGLRAINAGHGHAVGDGLLQAVAASFAEIVGPPGVLARLGGNEFAALLPGAPSAGPRGTANRMLDALRTPFALAGQKLRVDGRVGLARYRQGRPECGEDLLIDADLALHHAKRNAQRLAEAAPPDSAAAAERHTAWWENMRWALRKDRFSLHAQPVLDLTRNQVTHCELLLRREDGDELMTPSSFLPTAERLGVITEIDDWVIDRALALLAEPGNPLHVQVNISGRSLGDRRLLDFVRRRVDAYRAQGQLDPRRLTVEVTETALIANLSAARRFADELRGLGCQLALDDFGSGHGSFTNLKHLPFDMVKIDGEFVTNMLANKTDQIIVRSIIDMCKGLGIQTVAEFVEDAQTLEALREYGADFAQGYVVSRPYPAEQICKAQPPLHAEDRDDRPIQRLGPFAGGRAGGKWNRSYSA
jgi:diguanylate cyclase (GGDEF)-like protein/PAS domain S-box-containing protein